MKIGAFYLPEPIPELNSPIALAVNRPWTDVSSVGSMALSALEQYYGAKELARLKTPGFFFDFTRYRPTSIFRDNRRDFIIPNALLYYAKRTKGNDLIFLHLLEPHMSGEIYVRSIMRLLEHFGVQRYCTVGGMYDLVPHTRPLVITGSAVGQKAEEDIKKIDIQTRGRYQGPTSILSMISRDAADKGMDTMTFLIHLPQYIQLEEDHMGKAKLLEALSATLDLPKDIADTSEGENQYQEITKSVEDNQQVKALVKQFEAQYDAAHPKKAPDEPRHPPGSELSSEVEEFLKGLDFGGGNK